MQVKYGTSRTVLLLPYLNIAIKFPRIRLWRACEEIIYWAWRKEWSQLWEFFHYDYEQHGFIHYVGKGFIDNIVERRFYRETKNSLVWPSLFSLFGAINIQRLGNVPLDESHELGSQLFRRIYKIAGSEAIRDGHALANAHNFCLDTDGKYFLVDYASKTTQVIVTKYQKELREALRAS